MLKSILFGWLALCLALLPGTAECGDAIRAFSLREADRLLQQGTTSEELQNLAGITRFVGMVFDRHSGDVILVGKIRDDLPPVTVDDLCVALRCRLLSGKYPSVSIDMTDKTEKTGMQEVRFIGNIAQTQFGYDFLQSDVVLKKYSLDLLKAVEGVSPYLKHYEADMASAVEQTGRVVKEVQWYGEEESKKKAEAYKGKKSVPGKSVQSRFWFYVMGDASYIVEQDDVYVIEELRLGVKAETVAIGEDENQNTIDVPAEDFSSQFTEHYYEVCDANPVLKRLKAMFDLVCIAEGIANLGDARPSFEFLLDKHSVALKKTPEQYPLVHRIGEMTCKNGDVMLSQLSGGISLEAVLMALEDGDVNGLKIAVLGTRPGKNALSWDLPLDQWKMPNNNPPERSTPESGFPKKLEVEFPGFSMSAQRSFFPKDGTRMELVPFEGFMEPDSLPPLELENPTLQKHRRLSITARNAKLREALISNDWKKVADLLENVTVKTSDPVLRLIKAHACLAVNRNNESFRFFATATSADLAVWETWSYDLAKTHPLNSYAHYYRADALVRLEKHEDAIAEFTKSTELDKNNAYAFHGRGVLYAQMGKYDEAGKDLAEAQSIAPDVADFHNSRGMLRMAQRKGNLVRLEQQFKRATDLSQDFALAHHGLGCVELLRRPQNDIESIENLRKAHGELPEASLLFAANETDYERSVIEQIAFSIASKVEDSKMGMAIKREVTLGQLAEKYKIRKDAMANSDGLTKTVAKLPSWMGGYGQKKIESQIVNQVKGMSPREVQDFATRNPIASSSIADAIVSSHQSLSRRSKHNVLTTLPGVARYFKDTELSRGGSKLNLDMNHVNKQLDIVSQSTSRERLKLAVKANQLRNPIGTKLYDSATYGKGKTTPDNYKSTIQKYAPGPAINVQQGGATMDKREVVWGDYPWPFRPLFGLLYVSESNESAATTQPSEEATGPEKEPRHE